MNAANTAPKPAVRDLFLAALEMTSAAGRAVYLERACGPDAALRAKVEALLKTHDQDSFLERPAAELAPTLMEPSPAPSETPGAMIGRYKLLQKIGEGGCGVVYMAEQTEPVKRRVALKVIKLGMDTKSVIARFEAERQALALMDHPNIAKVLDGGTTGSADRSAGCQPAVSPAASRQGSTNAEVPELNESPQAGSPAIQQTGSLRYDSAGKDASAPSDAGQAQDGPPDPHSAFRAPHYSGRPYFVMELVRGDEDH